jgi:hypothetical protein
MNEREIGDRARIRPASRKVGRPVEPIVAWTREVEIVRDECFDRITVFRDISIIDALRYRYRIRDGHRISPLSRRVLLRLRHYHVDE